MVTESCEAWTFKATLPYLHISGSRAVFPGVGRVDNSNVLDNLLGPSAPQRDRAQNERRSVSGMLRPSARRC